MTSPFKQNIAPEMIAPTKRRSVWWAVVSVLGIAITLSLMAWQLDRAAQKNAIQAHIVKQNSLQALDNSAQAAIKNIAYKTDNASSANEFLHRTAVLTGSWLPAHTVYLDNRQMNGRVGFYVLTPLKLQDSASVVVVQRGWLPRDFQDRNRLTGVPTPAGIVQITGRIAASPSRLFELGTDTQAASTAVSQNAQPAPRDLQIRQNLDLVAFARKTQLDILPITLLQTEQANADGLLRNWPAIDAGVAKHYGYAFQWFALSVLIIVLYVWFQFIAPRRRARPQDV